MVEGTLAAHLGGAKLLAVEVTLKVDGVESIRLDGESGVNMKAIAFVHDPEIPQGWRGVVGDAEICIDVEGVVNEEV